jgi:hypothetical protein
VRLCAGLRIAEAQNSQCDGLGLERPVRRGCTLALLHPVADFGPTPGKYRWEAVRPTSNFPLEKPGAQSSPAHLQGHSTRRSRSRAQPDRASRRDWRLTGSLPSRLR